MNEVACIIEKNIKKPVRRRRELPSWVGKWAIRYTVCLVCVYPAVSWEPSEELVALLRCSTHTRHDRTTTTAATTTRCSIIPAINKKAPDFYHRVFPFVLVLFVREKELFVQFLLGLVVFNFFVGNLHLSRRHLRSIPFGKSPSLGKWAVVFCVFRCCSTLTHHRYITD